VGTLVEEGVAELPVQMGYRVNPDSVLVAQPFNLFIKVLAPKGVRFEFPPGPDTTRDGFLREVSLFAVTDGVVVEPPEVPPP